MITFRDRMTRGASRTGWLDSRHTFSFSQYRDPEHTGFQGACVSLMKTGSCRERAFLPIATVTWKSSLTCSRDHSSTRTV